MVQSFLYFLVAITHGPLRRQVNGERLAPVRVIEVPIERRGEGKGRCGQTQCVGLVL